MDLGIIQWLLQDTSDDFVGNHIVAYIYFSLETMGKGGDSKPLLEYTYYNTI